MKNAKLTVTADGILTITVDLKKGLGESASGKSILVARSDGRMENLETPNGTYYIAMTVGLYKNAPGKRQEKAEPELVEIGWNAAKEAKTRQAERQAAPARTGGIAPGQTARAPMGRR